MPASLSHLPDDPAELRALVITSCAALAAREEELNETRVVLAARDREIEALKLTLLKLRRMQFGRSSEKLTVEIGQLELLLEELESEGALTEVATVARPPRQRPARRPLPPHLPRESVVHAPACTCPDCGGTLRPIGESVSEMLEYVPARFKVIRHVRPKLACAGCETIIQAPATSRPIARGLAGPGLLAHVLVSKYADHLPLYRQSQIYAREGVDLDRSTLADWVGQFKRGRELSAWLGLVPREHSTGGKQRLLSINKRGSFDLRKLVIHGARSCYLNMNRSQHRMGPWIDEMANRGLHRNIIVVAIANKLARICWAVMRDGDVYHCAKLSRRAAQRSSTYLLQQLGIDGSRVNPSSLKLASKAVFKV